MIDQREVRRLIEIIKVRIITVGGITAGPDADTLTVSEVSMFEVIRLESTNQLFQYFRQIVSKVVQSLKLKTGMSKIAVAVWWNLCK